MLNLIKGRRYQHSKGTARFGQHTNRSAIMRQEVFLRLYLRDHEGYNIRLSK